MGIISSVLSVSSQNCIPDTWVHVYPIRIFRRPEKGLPACLGNPEGADHPHFFLPIPLEMETRRPLGKLILSPKLGASPMGPWPLKFPHPNTYPIVVITAIYLSAPPAGLQTP